ncbi:MAG: hypothetical protein LBU07_00760 [Coriobacteriales bacterium]|nr:hypothetical protein [Coriobacteriales bacterium]
MLSRGRRDNLYLYELTEQDLVLQDAQEGDYAVGNIVIFSNKKDIALGREIAKADDLATAHEYLKNSTELLVRHLRSLEARLSEQSANIDGRDTLLRELAEDLESQRYSNQLLITQLEQLKEQVNIERLSREEVVDDLEQISAATYSKDIELSRVIEDKLTLEQELAAMIADLIELNAQNEDLKRRLEKPLSAEDSLPEIALLDSTIKSLPTEDKSCKPPALQAGSSSTSVSAAAPTAAAHGPGGAALPGSTSPGTNASADGHAAAGSDAAAGAGFDEVVTMSSGKQIHLYYDVPLLQNGRRHSAGNRVTSIARFFLTLLVAAAVILVASILATASMNDMSLGAALDSILKSLGLP